MPAAPAPFKKKVTEEIFDKIPEAIRDSWPLETILVDVDGHASDPELLGFLQFKIQQLNDELARAGKSHRFKIAGIGSEGSEPIEVHYIWQDSQRICVHSFDLQFSPNPNSPFRDWTVPDPAKEEPDANLDLQIGWVTKIL
jgi:hypothetical protein